MRKILALLVSIMMLALPLITHAATPQKFDWSGGPGHSHSMALEKTLEEISQKAAHEAYLYGLPVEYKTQDGSVLLRAYPDYGKSKCNLVHVKAFEHGKFVMNTIKEVCDRNYELVTPYVPTVPSFPSTR